LLANVGYAQLRNGTTLEPALVTIGDDLNTVAQYLAPGRQSYSAADVVESLLSLTAGVPQRADSLLEATA
jgi:nitronate monooxygenase